MPAIQTVCIALLLTVVLLFDKCFGYPSIRQRPVGRPGGGFCSSCGDACYKCDFGVVTLPHCGRVCAKGPNEICGGYLDVLGVCGDGMFCNCNRCDGCSTSNLNCTMQKSHACPASRNLVSSIPSSDTFRLPSKTRKLLRTTYHH